MTKDYFLDILNQVVNDINTIANMYFFILTPQILPNLPIIHQTKNPTNVGLDVF